MEFFKTAWSLVGRKFGTKCRFTALYLFFLLLSFIAAFALPITILITLPFVILPFTFSYIACINAINYEKNISALIFFRFYKTYYSPAFFGGFRGMLGFLKMILAEIVISLIVGLLFYYLYCAKQPGFVEIMQQIEAASDGESLSIAFDNLMKFQPFILITMYTSEIALLIGSLVFINHILLQSEIYCRIFTSKLVPPMKFLRPVFARMWQLRKKDYLKVYIPSTCYIYLIFFIGIGGMFVLSNFFFHFDLFQSFILGLAVSFLLNFFFLPFFVDLLNCINISSNDEYNQAIMDVTKNLLLRARKKHALTEEQLKQLEIDLGKACERFKTSNNAEESKEEEKNKKT